MSRLGKGCCIVILSFLPFNLIGQDNLDSLYQVWKNQNMADTLRADALESYIYSGPFRTNPDSAIILANELYDLNQKIGDQEGMVEALNLKGYTSFRKGEYINAMSAYEKGLKLALEIGDTLGAADILLRTGYVYHDNEDYLKAIEFYERSLKLYEKLDDLIGKGNVYNEFGSIYQSRGDFDKSLEYYLESVKINDSLDNGEGDGAVYNNIGNLYLNEQNFDTALIYFHKSLAIEKKNNDQLGIASAMGGIGAALLDKGEFGQALELLQQSLRISEAINDVQGGIATRLNIADIHLENEEYSKAITAFKKSLEEAKSIGDLGNQEYAYEGLYECYRALGNSVQALENYEKMLAISDSLKTEETAIKLQQMEFAKQVLADSLLQVEKDLQIEMKHQEEVRRKDKNRNVAIGIGILFLLLAIGFFSRWRYVRKSRAIIKKEKDRSENLLLNILPAEIAEELKEKGEAKARDFEMVSILFTDFKDFTEQSAKVSATALIDEINYCFKNFDMICEKYGVEKIKTIGDAYMAAGGLPVPSEDSAEKTVLAALEMQSFMQSRFNEENRENKLTFEMRVGIHTGPVVAGIVGVKKFQYDIWGDTVNTASRIESNGEVGKVNISDDTYKILKDNPKFAFINRGKIQAKGKGQLDMWFVDLV